MIRGWRKGAAAIGALILLIGIGIGVLCAVDQNPDVGENKGVVSGFDPLAEPGEDVAKEKGIIPAHALGIANIVSEEPFREEFQEFTDYFISDVREGGYYRIKKREANAVVLDGKIPIVAVDNQTGAIMQIGVIW